MKKLISLTCLLALAIGAMLPSIPAEAAAYTEYGMYVEKPASMAGNRFYHGAKFEPKTGSYLGIFAEGDHNMHDFNAPDDNGWYFGGTPRVTGKEHAVYMLYLPYSSHDFNHYIRHYAAAEKRGKAMQICMEPDQGLAAVKDDEKLRRWAEEARDAKIPIFFRFASEFNDESNNWHKDGPEMYKEKFRLVANVFHKIAPNVAMVWAPNDWPIGSEHAYYPGDEYVDWVGVSSYPPFEANGRPKQNNTWIDRFREIYNSYGGKKPIMITEGAAIPNVEYTSTDVTDPAQYEIQRFYASAARRYPNLKMIIYWSNNEQWRGKRQCQLSDKPIMLNSYKKAISEPYYLGNFNTSSETYFEPMASSTLKAGPETFSAYANDVNQRIAKAVYYVNGKYVGEGTFPTFNAKVDLSSFANQRVKVSCEFYNTANAKVKTISMDKTVVGKPLRIRLNDKFINSDPAPYIKDGSTMLPVRAVSEALNAEVTWDQKEKMAVVKKGDRTLKFYLGKNTYDAGNGKTGSMRVPVELNQNRTFIPVRAAAEALDIAIDWNAGERIVEIREK